MTEQLGPDKDTNGKEYASMYVVKRDGRREKVQFDKITSRIRKLCYSLNEAYVDPCVVSQKVWKRQYAATSTSNAHMCRYA